MFHRCWHEGEDGRLLVSKQHSGTDRFVRFKLEKNRSSDSQTTTSIRRKTTTPFCRPTPIGSQGFKNGNAKNQKNTSLLPQVESRLERTKGQCLRDQQQQQQ